MLNVEQLKNETGDILSKASWHVWGNRGLERKLELIKESWSEAFRRFVMAEEAIRLLEGVEDKDLTEVIDKTLNLVSKR